MTTKLHERESWRDCNVRCETDAPLCSRAFVNCTAKPPHRTCGTCLLHSGRDACCELNGATRRRGDAACAQWANGKTQPAQSLHANPDPVCADCGRDLPADGYCVCAKV